MNRRTFLASGAATAGAATAGCLGLFETQSVPTAPSTVTDRPDAVYVPSHVEGMQMAGMATAGRLKFALSYAFPHRFWLVNGDRTNRVAIREEDSAHLMLTVWDSETGTVMSSSNNAVQITKDGETVVSKSMWPMLSQNMGLHFGDNVALDGDGTYEVTATFGPVSTRRSGDFAGAFGERAEATITMEFARSKLDELMYENLPERKGNRTAVTPMSMEMTPVAQLPAREDMPGTVRGDATSGDATLLVTTLDSPPAGIEAGGTTTGGTDTASTATTTASSGDAYLAVSPRTPYNRYPLPFMALSGTLARDGSTVFDGPLTATLDPELGYHYGAVVEGVDSGDDLTITVDTPTQLSRHEGYETAFLDMPAADLSLS
jgi:hypothetical protein